MQDINQTHKLLLFVLVFLAPFWLPVAITVVTVILVVLGGLLTVFSFPILSVILLLLLGVFGTSLLFGRSVPVSELIEYSLAWGNGNKEMKNCEHEVEMKDSWDAFI